ncbi:hypothetical protein M405DRAFT_821370, partial [Rhizopogon salebrosus TDB-379]
PVVPTDDDPDELLVLGFALVWVLVWIDDGVSNRSPCINMVTALVVARRMVVVLDKPEDVYTD